MAGRSDRGESLPLGFAIGAGAVVAAGASLMLARTFAARVLTPAPKPEHGVCVLALEASDSAPGGQRVWLQGPDVDLEGGYSFIFDAPDRLTQHLAGHARLGPVVDRVRTRTGVHVAREVLSVERGELRVGALGRITGWWYTEPEQLGYESTRVALPLPGGVGWGWVIRPERPQAGRWAVHVHGRGALPQETLRGVEAFAERGVTSLVMTYRNDVGAPQGRNGRYGLGLAEQLDVDAALGWVRAQGARRVTLVGWSMGGTATVLAAGGGRNASIVDGMVLDSPALDWPDTLRAHARRAHLPRFVAELGLLMLRIGRPAPALEAARGTDLAALTPRRLAPMIRVPTLIHASADDTFVPWRGSLRVAQLRPGLVRLHPMRGEHVKLWNADPAGWKAETGRFLDGL